MRFAIQKIMAILLLLSITGCMSTNVELDITATDNLNLNQFDEALPVVLRVYQLSDIQSFKTATFEELWKSDKSVLANTLITLEERTINPAEKATIAFEQAENARFVAIVALFRDRQGDKWKTYHPLGDGPVKLSTSLDVLITNNEVQLPDEDEVE
ncbi:MULTISPECIES: type VI secretion system lipoprotein TssJ [unclassified Pseudoalteromonas]|uniref:type VI secretion system lipoprotein TssJ n=1 Tax=unclassified Pseudoalteromonas TaxID=194690 RepID=UPI0025B50CEC|nr:MULTISPECIES: type VI secretion system lipoprotein TssJ [unclassified Pseudoalteromonas]MDN3380857.1 type VI secretion system lipoprotein TssJ [Pseudoalteromonas sp. APC 3893]MDN3389264.1 type VI secretion system lipoprotein TssJ [Pseudoalteromonas sp. APC 4017]